MDYLQAKEDFMPRLRCDSLNKKYLFLSYLSNDEIHDNSKYQIPPKLFLISVDINGKEIEKQKQRLKNKITP